MNPTLFLLSHGKNTQIFSKWRLENILDVPAYKVKSYFMSSHYFHQVL